MQQHPLLQTKLYVPPIRHRLVSRPRLVERLNAGLNRKLTLVSAPAGYGKTTLVTEWLNCVERPFTWLCLDENDNDPARFLTYLVVALQTVDPNIGQAAQAMLQVPQSPPQESLLTTLINDVASTPVPFLLVLDDYHLIDAPSIHQQLGFLLNHQPPQMHLVVVTRADPLLPLSRLRARSHMVEIRTDDLRFTVDEVAEFLNQVMGLNLSTEHTAALEARTEGWIVGLQMAALSLQSQEDTAGFIQAFSGSHQFILDYLMDEVIGRMPEAVYEFLLHTSILERMTRPLCDAVCSVETDAPVPTGTTVRDDGSAELTASAQTMLEMLHKANLFVVSLDTERCWYRYHHLFADLLRNRLTRLHAGRVPELHRRASLWYEHNGLIWEAVSHALNAGDRRMAADLVERYSWQLLERGEILTVAGWLTALPEELVLAWPALCISHAWILVLTGQLDAVEPRLQVAEKNPDLHSSTAENQDLLAHIAAIRAYAASQEGDARRAIVLARESLQTLSEHDLPLRSIMSFTLGLACAWAGDVAGACQAYTQASELGRAAGQIHTAVLALSALGGQQMALGRLQQAAETFQTVLQLATGQNGKPLPITARAHSGLSEVYYERNDLEAAMSYAEQSIELGVQWGNVEVMARTPLALAQALQAQGDMVSAYDAFQKAARIVHQHDMSLWAIARLEACRVRLWLAPVGGNLAAAARWAEGRESVLREDADLPYAQEREHLALARVLMALERHGDALGLLARLRAAASAGDRVGRVIEILVLEAAARQLSGELRPAICTLEEALSLAEPEGCVRIFVDEGLPVAALLSEMIRDRQSPHAAYMARLLAAFGVEVDDRGRAAKASPDFTPDLGPAPLVEALTERELEVLGCIAAGLSNAEIAQELVIAVSTVKRHINHIFGKLDVTSRTQAIVRARELGLV